MNRTVWVETGIREVRTVIIVVLIKAKPAWVKNIRMWLEPIEWLITKIGHRECRTGVDFQGFTDGSKYRLRFTQSFTKANLGTSRPAQNGSSADGKPAGLSIRC